MVLFEKRLSLQSYLEDNKTYISVLLYFFYLKIWRF